MFGLLLSRQKDLLRYLTASSSRQIINEFSNWVRIPYSLGNIFKLIIVKVITDLLVVDVHLG